MDMMSTLNILNSRQIFKEFLKPVSFFRNPQIWHSMDLATKSATVNEKGINLHISNHLTKKDKVKDVCVHNMSC